MRNFGHTRPAEAQKPECEVLPDGRKRITRYFDVPHGSQIPDLLNLPWGEIDTGETEFEGWSGLRLVGAKSIDAPAHPSSRARDTRPLIALIFEQIPETGEIQVGFNTQKQLEDGRTALEAQFLQFSSDTFVPQTIGASTAPGDASAFLMTEDAPNDGTLHRITRTYVHEGILETDLQTDQGGALLIQTIKSAVTVPATPSGFTLVGQPVQSPDGLPTYTYTYAKGLGTVLTRVSIENNGKLKRYFTTSLGVTPAAPAPTIGGTVVQVDSSTRQAKGYAIYDAEWAEGIGVIQIRQDQRLDGLRLESWVSLGQAYDPSFMLPPGVLQKKDEEEISGGKRFVVTCIQSADGDDPDDGVVQTYQARNKFLYPGRAKAFTTPIPAIAPDGTGFTAYAHEVFLDPPISVGIDATVQVSYQTSLTLGTLAHPRWNPDNWATIWSKWEGWDIAPHVHIQSLTGYRAVGSPVNFTAGPQISAGGTVILTGVNTTCMGNRVYGTSSGQVKVVGGPSAPDGLTLTLDAFLSEGPAFVGLDGTEYYRKTVIFATIPTQTALPV